MAISASQYYAKAKEYESISEYYANLANSYNSYNNKLSKLKKSINKSKEYMEDGQNNFKSGGYVADGISLDEENLTSAINSLESSGEYLDNIMSKTAMLAEDYTYEKDRYYRLYQEAYSDYLEAKNEE